jgi:AhpD family alkylhydroperoxidase
MEEDSVKRFNDYRSRMNSKITGADNLVLKRLFNLDANAYQEGAVPARYKEMMGLVASMVLRCDDCIKYHLEKVYEQHLSDEELFEILAIANIVGGTIVIPHTRRAVEFWEALKLEK